MEDKMDIREKVLNALCEVNEEVRENQDKDLLAYGILTSFDVISMMMELEDMFGIEIPAEAVTPGNFRSVDSVVMLIEGLLR